MVFPSIEGLRNSYRSIQPHKMVRQVTVGPSCREAPYMQDGKGIRVAGPLRGLRSPFGGCIAWVPETRGGLCYPGMPFLGRVRVPIPG